MCYMFWVILKSCRSVIIGHNLRAFYNNIELEIPSYEHDNDNPLKFHRWYVKYKTSICIYLQLFIFDVNGRKSRGGLSTAKILYLYCI